MVRLTRILIPLVGVAVIGLILREAYATGLGSAGASAGGFGRGIGQALEGVGSGIGSIPANILGGFGSGLSSLSGGISSFLNLFGANSSTSPASNSGNTNPVVRIRTESNPTAVTYSDIKQQRGWSF